MKKVFEDALIEVVAFESDDVLTMSTEFDGFLSLNDDEEVE